MIAARIAVAVFSIFENTRSASAVVIGSVANLQATAWSSSFMLRNWPQWFSAETADLGRLSAETSATCVATEKKTLTSWQALGPLRNRNILLFLTPAVSMRPRFHIQLLLESQFKVSQDAVNSRIKQFYPVVVISGVSSCGSGCSSIHRPRACFVMHVVV